MHLLLTESRFKMFKRTIRLLTLVLLLTLAFHAHVELEQVKVDALAVKLTLNDKTYKKFRNSEVMYIDSVTYLVTRSIKLKIYLEQDESDEYREPVDYTVNGNGTATSVRVDSEGYMYFMTCYHVIDKKLDRYAGNMEYVDSDIYISRRGKKMRTSIVYEDSDLDIAILKSDEPMKGPVIKRYGNMLELQVSDVTVSYGFPSAGGPFMTFGRVSKTSFNANGEVCIVTQASISPGNSGGGMWVLKDGLAYYMGMARFTYVVNNIYGFIPVTDIKKALHTFKKK
jgi:S1-C subfamily serine protease